ncbi:Type 5 capsule protein repressor C-terminal domain [Propionibacterium ruminifibrarum]|uniref:Nuclease SbcCD subunit D n=1 Tax=Propionibacterium ruminifibrarum TaxID=1962131 RepID=A0A375HZI1_9ACTN|nr:exonuclease SbcCD subunit D [Propionibacterium ruminifibrarum]SPF67892.1 Type 5 capsule protein repressor C-terminal domain [Propionibacterium ruminifibrarum]
MRILHTSDWHLGRTLHGVDLSDAHERFLDHLADLAAAERVDAVLVSGDVFDRALPPVAAVELLDRALARLCEIACVVVTPGNHDSPQRLGLNAGLLGERLHICARPAAVATPVTVPAADGATGLLVYALPYLDPDMTRAGLAAAAGSDEPLARSHEAVVGAALRLVRDDLAARRSGGAERVPAVVMAHEFVTGGRPSESERDLRIGGVDSVPAALFSSVGADYVALGHLHGPQAVAGSRDPQERGGGGARPAPVMRYAGSPLAFSFSEKDHRKSTAVVDFDDSGAVAGVRLVPAPVPRRLSDVAGSLDEVLGPRFAARREDWVRVTVTGESRPDNLVHEVKKVFPHALQVLFEPTGRRGRSAAGAAPGADDPLAVTADFVGQVSGEPPNQAERQVLAEALEAAERRG